jgi:hypothetical protein
MKKLGSGPDGHIRVAVHKSQGRLLRVVLGKPTSDGPSTLVTAPAIRPDSRM